jgi:hypothetical protein
MSAYADKRRAIPKINGSINKTTGGYSEMKVDVLFRTIVFSKKPTASSLDTVSRLFKFDIVAKTIGDAHHILQETQL